MLAELTCTHHWRWRRLPVRGSRSDPLGFDTKP